MSTTDLSQYTLPNSQPIVALDCESAFNGLNNNEKLYAHYLSQASWAGCPITMIQASPEAPLIFTLLHKVFLKEPIDKLEASALAAGVSESEFTAFLVYTCGVLGNSGNYKGFGSSKIIPNLPEDKFEKIIHVSAAYQRDSVLKKLFNEIKGALYSLDESVKSLGLKGKGVTTYFSANCTEKDSALVTEFLQFKSMEPYTQRCFKTVETFEEGGQTKTRDVYELRFASIEKSKDPTITLPDEIFKDAKFTFTRGDYSELLVPVVKNLEKAKNYAATDNERMMLEKYISHFTHGRLEDHKDGSRFWIKDKEPAVETYIGFIEVYRDPAGQRGEFEGFVAMVNREMSKKFATLVTKAEDFLAKLPWGKNFEKDTFLRPDFTSLDVLTFANSLVPAGINIPNYDEIRQSEGFKNVSLGNVMPASMKVDKIAFLSDEDQHLMNTYRVASFEVQVGLHELLGHGSGKFFKEISPGQFNFDTNIINPVTGKIVDKYYKIGESYNSKFGALKSPYEECRAEAVGLYLCLERDILKIFGFENGEKAEELIYVNWLSMMWTGCGRALEMYNPTTKTWLQAHSQARFVLLNVCLEAGEGFVTVKETDDGKNLRLTVDKDKIHTVGKKAIENFLMKLQVYRSTGDIETAKKMFDGYSAVPADGPQPWAKWRDIVLAHKEPRKIFVQANTFVADDDANITMKKYDSSFEGFIQSWIERFPSHDVSEVLLQLYEKDKIHFPLNAAQ